MWNVTSLKWVMVARNQKKVDPSKISRARLVKIHSTKKVGMMSFV